MKQVLRAFAIAHGLVALLFAAAGAALIVVATRTGFDAVVIGGLDLDAAQRLIEALGLLAAAVVALQISQTIVEEEVVRDAQVSAPTRVRRYLSRFFVVILVALSVEGLVATFKAVHEDMAGLFHAASLLLATAAMLAAWGLFVRLNRYAEELEPEAMQEAKREDKKIK